MNGPHHPRMQARGIKIAQSEGPIFPVEEELFATTTLRVRFLYRVSSDGTSQGGDTRRSGQGLAGG